jgi:hypothetical protein
MLQENRRQEYEKTVKVIKRKRRNTSTEGSCQTIKHPLVRISILNCYP